MESFAANLIEDEDEDEASSDPPNIEHALERFRQAWRCELRARLGRDDEEDSPHQDEEASIEEQAKYLFLQGVKSEQSGRVYDAICYYRRAVQLVPDIEFKVDYKHPKPERQRTVSEVSTESVGEVDVDEEDLDNLIQRFHRLRASDARTCETETGQNSMHISELPVELLNIIFKWVVSNDLDIFSLEALAKVSRGFYMCARDEELWRLICQRVWGYNPGNVKQFGSWRNMYIQRPHLRFHGCYISKMTYYRSGERGLDNYYKPFHMVEYYRYIRFFPEGQMLMLTTPDEPNVVVSKLRSRGAPVQGILHGYYKMAGDHVTAVLKKRKVIDYLANTYTYYRNRKRRDNHNQNEGEQVYNAEFLVRQVGKRPHAGLVWQSYSIRTSYKSSGEENVCDFELNNQSFPQMYFSRVKSYTASSEIPLE